MPLEIKYGYFVPEVGASQATTCPADSGSSVCYYWDRYVDRCLPTHTTSRCGTYADAITSAGYTALPTLLSSTTVPTSGTTSTVPSTSSTSSTAPTLGTVIFQDTFVNGISKWVESGQREWQGGTLDDSAVISGETRSNKIAEADDCDDESCILALRDSVNLSEYSAATLEFHRYVDNSLDRGEYLKVEVGNNNRWTEIFKWTDRVGDDSTWHKESYNLSGYLQDGFKVRFVTEQSSSTEDVGIDNVKITGTLSAPSQCTLDVRASLNDNGGIDATWNNSCSDIKRYKVYYSENGQRNTYLGSTTSTAYTYSSPGEGDNYTIKVKAQYSNGGSYTQYFESNTVMVPVSDVTSPVITVPSNMNIDLPQYHTATTLSYTASAYDMIDGTVPVSCTPTSGSTAPIGITVVTCTATDSAANVGTGSFIVNVHAYTAPVNPQTSTVKEFYGGNEYSLITQNATHVSKPSSTLTIGITNSTGINGIVVSGHGLEIDPGFTFVEHAIGATNTKITSELVPVSNSGSVDAAFIPITEPNIIVGSKVQALNGTVFDVTQGTLSDVERGEDLSSYGMRNNGDGSLLFKNATVYHNEMVFYNMGIALYPSMTGDSGAPIIRHSDDNSKIVGVHRGGVCIFDSVSENQQRVNVTNTNSICQTDNYYYKVFSAWENVKERLNLR